MADSQQTDYDSRPETVEHIRTVRRFVWAVAADLMRRGRVHDASKLVEPEKACFDEFSPKLRDSTYGSDEYKEFLAAMGEGLTHHYEVNDHHPEHFQPREEHLVEVHIETAYHPKGDEYIVATAMCSACEWTARGDEADTRDAAAVHASDHFHLSGIHAMNIMQLAEMLCDWIAATQRHDDDKDIHDSIEQNASRFGYGEEIEELLHTSADAILEISRTHTQEPPNRKFRNNDVVEVDGRRGVVMHGAFHEPTDLYPIGYWQYAISEDGTQVKAFPDNPFEEDRLCTVHHD